LAVLVCCRLIQNGIQPRQNGALKVKFMIHHHFPGIELVFPVYAGDGVECYLSPDQRVEIGSTTQARFNIDPTRESISALIYKLKRKNIDQSNEDGTSSEEETTYTQLIVVWKVDMHGDFWSVSLLIEHDKGLVLDRDSLMRLAKCYKLFGIQHVPIEETWLLHDDTVLMIRTSVTHKQACYKLEMSISETSIKDDTQRLQYIGLGRRVSMVKIMMLITMFIMHTNAYY
jgi:hypothetical protein